MTEDIRQKVLGYLASHQFMRLGTVTAESTPMVHTVAYASDGPTVYFATDRRTRKILNISKNPEVAFSIDEDYADVSQIQGIQLEARATILSGKAEIEKASGLLVKKFPGMAKMPPELDVVFVKVEPGEGYFLDYTKGFTHRDKIEF
jgi:nitroimidazol reductase NimA-like FMN-containing flavoprotein (pyridoxamine 5'-phosphate oxidase superfamily)